ncbi:MAG: hypothetical protein ACK5AZ_26905, partial [Bryobacteraceae bacterium]
MIESTVQRITAGLKPEAAYFFTEDNGERAISIVFDMKDSSQMAAVAEPWFLAFNARVSFRPVMRACPILRQFGAAAMAEGVKGHFAAE